MRLNPENLITFAAVVREGGVGAAARSLHLTQPAVSNQLRKLQESVGEALYRRAGRGIELTGAGRRLYEEAQRLANVLAAAESVADALSAAETGLVRIAASQTLGAYLLPAVLAAFRAYAPGIEVELESHNSRRVFELLQNCDIGLVEGVSTLPLPANRRSERLGRDEIVAVLRNDDPLSKRHALSPGQLATQALIWRESGSGTRERVEQAFHDAGVTPHVGMALSGVAAVKEAVRQGLGIGFASRLALRHDSGPLVGVPLRPRLMRVLSIITPGNPTPAVTRFMLFLHRQLAADADLAG
jgi:DNA-binding transcriptional LysR family regulator